MYKLVCLSFIPLLTGHYCSKSNPFSMGLFDTGSSLCRLGLAQSRPPRPEENVGFPALSVLHSHYLFEMCYLTKPGAKLAVNKNQWLCYLCSVQSWDYRHEWGYTSFYVGVTVWTSSLWLHNEHSDPLNRFSNP